MHGCYTQSQEDRVLIFLIGYFNLSPIEYFGKKHLK